MLKCFMMLVLKRIIFTVIISLLLITTVTSQCYKDRHSTNAYDGWISCAETPNPNNILGNSHWILYNLGENQNLYKSTFWNSNHPNHLAWGVKKMRFDYSMDSINWSYLTTFEFNKAPGHSLYEGEAGPNFNGVMARYILLTPLENYGAVCVGFSEIRMNTEPSASNTLSLNLNPCVNEGIIYNIDAGVQLGGIYSGVGVVNNYEDKFDFDPDAAGPGSHTITYQYVNGNGNLITKTTTVVVKNCGAVDCPPCPPCAPCGNEPALTFNEDPVPNGLYYKNPTISSNGTVNNAFNVEYRASNNISLNNNFSVEAGANFKADITDCDDEANLLVNGDFESDTTNGWQMELHDVVNAQLSIDNFNAYDGNSCAKVNVSSATETIWHIQFEQFGMNVNNGDSYSFSFAAKTNQPKSVWVQCGRHNSPWNSYGGTTANLTAQWQIFTFTIVPDETNIGQTRFSIMLSYPTAPATYWFDNLKMIKN